MNEEIITKELQAFDITAAALAEMKDSFMQLTVADVNDSHGFEKVHEARMIVKKTRVKVEKTGVDLRRKKKSEIEDYLKLVSKTEIYILGELAPIEKHLQSQEDFVTAEKARIKAEEEAKAEALIQVRRDRLNGIGISFNGQMWSFQDMNLPEAMLKATPDDQFELFFGKFQEKVQAENARLKAEEDARKVESERIAKLAAEQEEERQRLAEIARKQTEEAARIKDEQKQIADAKQKVLDDAKHAQELEEIRVKAVEQARIDVEAKIKRQVEEKAAADLRAKIEAEKKAARAPDKVKLRGFADAHQSIVAPELKTQEARTILDEFLRGISVLTKSLREKAELL